MEEGRRTRRTCRPEAQGHTALRVILSYCRCWLLSIGNQLAQLLPLGSVCSTGSRDRKKREGNEGIAGEGRDVES